MSLIEIKKVESKKDLKTFIDFHYDLYEGNEYDVPNLFSDEMNTLSKDKNAAFEFCEAEYYLAYKDGKLAGRVAAIINHKANNKWGKKSVRFGWIDFIDDREVSKALLDAVEKYGKEKGMEAVSYTHLDVYKRQILSIRNWIAVLSVTIPICPPSASISRTICPLAIPPMAGLQLI